MKRLRSRLSAEPTMERDVSELTLAYHMGRTAIDRRPLSRAPVFALVAWSTRWHVADASLLYAFPEKAPVSRRRTAIRIPARPANTPATAEDRLRCDSPSNSLTVTDVGGAVSPALIEAPGVSL